MTGKRIVFCTFGSLGDIYPFLSLAREMKRRGHTPLIATSPVYRQLIEGEGILFCSVRPDIDVSDPAILIRAMDRRTGSRYIMPDIVFRHIRDSYDDTAAAAATANLIVIHPITLGALLVARKSTVPWASAALAPVSLYSVYDPPILSGVPFADRLATFGLGFQRGLQKTVAFLFEPLWNPFRKLEKNSACPRWRIP